MSRPRRDQIRPVEQIDPQKLTFREQWAGDRVLGPLLRLAPLTANEQEALNQWRLDTWVPQRALRYAWQRVDPVHGRGGSMYIGRPRRPGDPDAGDGWRWSAFVEALEADRDAVEIFAAEYPAQRARLLEWLELIESLGRRREADEQPAAGTYYQELGALGYDSRARFTNGEEIGS